MVYTHYSISKVVNNRPSTHYPARANNLRDMSIRNFWKNRPKASNQNCLSFPSLTLGKLFFWI